MESNNKSYSYFLAALNAKIYNLNNGAAGLAAKAGLSRGYITNIISGVKTAGYNAQIKIAEAFGNDLEEFLAFGRSVVTGSVISRANNYVYIPKVEAKPSAGFGSFAASENVENLFSFRADWITKKGNPQNMVLMDVLGDSMSPFIMDNDTVMIDMSRKDLLPNQVYAVRVEDLIYLKYIDREPGKFILRSHNTNYAPINIETQFLTENSFAILGRVIWWCHDVFI